MKLHYTTEGVANSRYRKIKATINALGAQVEQVAHEGKADLSKVSVFPLLPLLETAEGSLFSSNTIIRYLAAINENKLYGTNLHQRALIDQWLDVTTCDFEAAVAAVSAVKEGKEVDIGAVSEDIHKFLAVVNTTLNGKKFLVGQSLSLADISLATSLSVVFSVMLGQEERKQYQHLVAWYNGLVQGDATLGSKQLSKEAHKFFKPKKAAEKKEKTEKAEKGGKGGKKKQEKAAQKEQGDDLFDESTEPAAPKPVVQKPKPKKKEVIAKSIVVFDVKVYEQQTDLNALAEKIKAEVIIDGLVWNNEPKILPVAFGMNKLQMGCVVEDAKVSLDDVYEKIEQWEQVQSTDTVSFQKL